MQSNSRQILCSVVALVTIASGCGGHAAPVASPLPVTPARVPPFAVPGYPTLVIGGSYPSLRGSEYATLNAALKTAVIAEERSFARFLQRERRHIPLSARRAMHGGFELSFKRSLVSASTEEFSALMDATECEPGGTGCNYWFAVTLRVPSGEPVTLRSIFSNSTAGLRALAEAAKQAVLHSNKCIASSPNIPGFLPTWRNYKAFALTARGIAVGFDTSQVGFPVCGPVNAIVAIEKIERFLSPSGMRLLESVRNPGLDH